MSMKYEFRRIDLGYGVMEKRLPCPELCYKHLMEFHLNVHLHIITVINLQADINFSFISEE